jgi:hypothetical protein
MGQPSGVIFDGDCSIRQKLAGSEGLRLLDDGANLLHSLRAALLESEKFGEPQHEDPWRSRRATSEAHKAII